MSDIANQRLYNQRLDSARCQTPAAVVAWLGAVQAQEYALAKWGLGLRMAHATDDAVEQALTNGDILRTHVMRPTWHFVTPADIRWLQALTAPRVHAFNAYMYRQVELDDTLFGRCRDTIIESLAGGKQLTREELGAALARVGIEAKGVRLAYIVMRAELEGVICSGGRRGKQYTYALIESRAPQARQLTREEALATLTQRYFTSHGPATVKDFAWWSGLTTADVKEGLALSKGCLVSEVIDSMTYWRAESDGAAQGTGLTALLLPPYDEYTIAYKNHDAILSAEHVQLAKSVVYGGTIVINGQLLGSWKRTISKGKIVIDSAPFRPFTVAEQETAAVAVQRFGAFVGMPAQLA
ncbi:MAG: AlkZ family DNA glycosylase [Anaerolineae bacterium]|nr:AlkZ family DNA glycosylase [Anaerolineae bacterium]